MTNRKVILTATRVNEALAALKKGFTRLVKQADKRIVGPSLADSIAGWAEGLAAVILEVKQIDLEMLAVLEAEGVEALTVSKAVPGRHPVPRPDPTFSKVRERTLEPTEVPEWLTRGTMKGAKAYIMTPGGCAIVVGRSEKHGWHLHAAHARRLPTWAELHDAVMLLVPSDVMMSMMFYPGGWGVPCPENRLSLYEVEPKMPGGADGTRGNAN